MNTSVITNTPSTKRPERETAAPAASLIKDWDEAEGTVARRRKAADDKTRIEVEAQARNEARAAAERVRHSHD